MIYIGSLQSLGKRMELMAVVDVVKQRARAVADQFPGAKISVDYTRVLDDADAVMFVLPHHLHYEAKLNCLAAGTHVLLEKPMANSERQCLEMIEVARKADRVLMVAYCMCFHPLIARTKLSILFQTGLLIQRIA